MHKPWTSEKTLYSGLVIIAAIVVGVVLGTVCAPDAPISIPIRASTSRDSVSVTQGGRLQVVHRQYVLDGGSIHRSIMIIRDQETRVEYLVVEEAGIARMTSAP